MSYKFSATHLSLNKSERRRRRKSEVRNHSLLFTSLLLSSLILQRSTVMKPQQKDSQNHAKTIPPYMKAVSGSLGGVMEACCLQPIDVIKTRLQLDRTGTYKGIVHCGTTVSRTEGVRALWKGLTPFATHLTLKYTLRMGSNAVFQSAFKDSETGKISNQARLLSGFGAGVLEALAIVTPFEVCHFLCFGLWIHRFGRLFSFVIFGI